MRWIALSRIKSESVLAQNVMDDRGRVLLTKGFALTPSIIERLRGLGIATVCIEDSSTDDVILNDCVRPETRQVVLRAAYDSLIELATGVFPKHVRSNKVLQRLRPLMKDVVGEFQSLGGTFEHLGTIYLSDGELYHHSVNVTFYAIAIAINMGLPTADIVELSMGTLLHDVGKLKIPTEILKKPARLTDVEYEQVKLHAQFGYEILKRATDLNSESILVALQHHERVNGTGYPNQLGQNQIHKFGKISAVADVYEALTASRVYRDGYLPHHALEFVMGAGGQHFDNEVIQAFVNAINVYPIGMTLQLSNGLRGVVMRSSRRQSHRPIVRVIEDVEGNKVPEPWEIDLSKELTIEIVGCDS